MTAAAAASFVQLFAVPDFMDALLDRRPGDDYDPGEIGNLVSVAHTSKSMLQEIRRVFPSFVCISWSFSNHFDFGSLCQAGCQNLRRLCISEDILDAHYLIDHLNALKRLVHLEDLSFSEDDVDSLRVTFPTFDWWESWYFDTDFKLDFSKRSLPDAFGFLNSMPKLTSLQLSVGHFFPSCQPGSQPSHCPLQFFLHAPVSLQKLTNLCLYIDGPMNPECPCSQLGAGIPSRVQRLEVTSFATCKRNDDDLARRFEFIAQREQSYKELGFRCRFDDDEWSSDVDISYFELSVPPRCQSLYLDEVYLRPGININLTLRKLVVDRLRLSDVPLLEAVAETLECLHVANFDNLAVFESLPHFPKLQIFIYRWSLQHSWAVVRQAMVDGSMARAIVEKMPNLHTLHMKGYILCIGGLSGKEADESICQVLSQGLAPLTALNLRSFVLEAPDKRRFTHNLDNYSKVLDLVESLSSLKQFEFFSSLTPSFRHVFTGEDNEFELSRSKEAYAAVMNRAQRVLKKLDYICHCWVEGDGVLVNKKRGKTLDDQFSSEIAKAMKETFRKRKNRYRNR